MRVRNSAEGYGAIAQFLHWLTVVLVAIAWMLGTFDDVLPKGAARAAGLFVHISAGVAILVALVARVIWRMADPPPEPAPTRLGAWLDSAGRLAHYALYALLVAVPVAGIVLQFARGDALPLFGFAEIPSPWLRDRTYARSAREVHEVLANALVMLAAFHAAAALVHHWIFRDRTLLRMLPDGRR
ncbi:MAG: cytochrome b [Reyranellaceae bacterium]